MDGGRGAVPVLLAHGARTSRTMWRRQVGVLEGAGIATLAVDLPGHGARTGERFTLDAGVAAIHDGVEALGGQALVVGPEFAHKGYSCECPPGVGSASG